MDLKRKGFQLPDKIRFDEETLTGIYGKLIVEPLERGFGITIGSALRRVLLSSVEGAAITAIKILILIPLLLTKQPEHCPLPNDFFYYDV